ncbi:MAG: hypothetical protein IJ193_00405 [Bacilli bacterium]|nr:hypothetical protein [Bacilli bacterium]
MSEDKTGLKVDLTSLKGNGSTAATEVEVIEATKRGRPKKKEHVEGPQVRAARSPLNDSTMSYLETYTAPATLVNNAITELNDIEARINADLEAVRMSRTLKSKYLYIANLTGALTSTIGTKVSAIRELRSMIDQANNYELKRQQQLKINEQDSDDKIIADMYNAYINYNPGTAAPGAANMVMPTQYINSNHNEGVNIGGLDTGFANYMNNLTPQQNAMIQERNPFIETVLVYDQTNHTKWFEVIDTRTGMPVPNMELPNDFVKDGCTVDIRNGIARNASLNQTFKLKVVGMRAADEF